MQKPFLVVQNLKRDYHGGPVVVNALRGVDLTIAPGEIVALSGPSGSGKTTLLNLIGGLDSPTSGSITVGDLELANQSDRSRSAYRNRTVGFVFQNHNLLPHLTVLENIALPLLVAEEPYPAALKTAAEVLDWVGLSHRRDFRPGELSGGQAGRVALARALASNPSLLLGDEITGNLDSAAGEVILTLIRRRVTETNMTALIVSHDPAVARWADRTLSLLDGQLKAGHRAGHRPENL